MVSGSASAVAVTTREGILILGTRESERESDSVLASERVFGF